MLADICRKTYPDICAQLVCDTLHRGGNGGEQFRPLGVSFGWLQQSHHADWQGKSNCMGDRFQSRLAAVLESASEVVPNLPSTSPKFALSAGRMFERQSRQYAELGDPYNTASLTIHISSVAVKASVLGAAACSRPMHRPITCDSKWDAYAA